MLAGTAARSAARAGRLSSCPPLSPRSRVRPARWGRAPRGAGSSQLSPLSSLLPPGGERGFVAITSTPVHKPNFSSPDGGGPVTPRCPAVAEGAGDPRDSLVTRLFPPHLPDS